MNERPQLAALSPRGLARLAIATPGRLEGIRHHKFHRVGRTERAGAAASPAVAPPKAA